MRRLMLLSAAALISFLAIAARTEKAAVAGRFSDREIFEGVVFGVGPVANLVPEAREQLRPEIYARSADELASMTAVRTSLVASIERAEPGFIGEFARVARSGDPAAIRSMLERATESVNAAAVEIQTDGVNGSMFANMPGPRPQPDPMRPGPRPTPQLQQRPEQLIANMPGPRPQPDPMRPGPRPTPQLHQGPEQLIANMPGPRPQPDPMRPGPRPTPQLQQGPEQLIANMPGPRPQPDPMRPGPRPTPQLTSPQLAAQPAWALFSSQLFTDQLAASMALKLETSAPTEG